MRETKIPFGPGAAAVADALGFKDARNRHTVDDLIKTIKDVQASARGQANMAGFLGGLTPHVAAISDTVIMATGTQAADRNKRLREVTLSNAVFNLASCAAMMVVKAAMATKAPLAYRGCLAAGEIHAEAAIFVGGAIDEAAEFSEAAAAAIVWLAPSARKAVNEDPEPINIAYVEWDLPLRERGSVGVLAVNPFLHEAFERVTTGGLDLPELDRIERALLAPMADSSRLDVVQKLQNTSAFLKAAKAHTIANFEKLEDDYYESQQEAYEAHESGEDTDA
jgi:hypothetical protein